LVPNLYVDHLSDAFLSNSDELREQMVVHSQNYNKAAELIGLTPRETKEVKENLLLDRHITYGPLPKHIEAMAGKHENRVYAVHNAYIEGKPVMGWRIALSDGKVVYVPQVCGNLSVGYERAPVAVAVVHYHHVTNKKQVVAVYTPASSSTPTPVVIAPPPAVEVPAEASASVAAAPNTSNYTGTLLAVPILGGIIYDVIHPGTPTPVVPPCSAGSNAEFACKK
jgi:hypothetical protein